MRFRGHHGLVVDFLWDRLGATGRTTRSRLRRLGLDGGFGFYGRELRGFAVRTLAAAAAARAAARSLAVGAIFIEGRHCFG